MSDSDKHIISREEVIIDPVTKREAMRVRVDQIRDRNSPESLAIRLAEAFDTATKAQSDVEAFTDFANSEVQKATELRDLLHRIDTEGRENVRSINPKTGKPRRMDPLQEYDLGAIRAEMEMRKRRANEFRDKANKAKSMASDARREASQLQRKIHKAREAS